MGIIAMILLIFLAWRPFMAVGLEKRFVLSTFEK